MGVDGVMGESAKPVLRHLAEVRDLEIKHANSG